MYEETGCFDPKSMAEVGTDDGFSKSSSVPNSHNSLEENLKLSMEELSYHPNQQPPPKGDADAAAVAMEMELQHHLSFNMEHNSNITTHLMHQMGFHESNHVLPYDHHQSNWDHTNEMQQDIDLHNLFHLPRFSNSSISFANPSNHLNDMAASAPVSAASSVLYDPLFHLNLPPHVQPPLFRELFQPLSHGYTLPTSRGASLFGGEGDDQREDADGVGVGGHFDNGVLEFTRDMACGKGRNASGKMTKHFATERERRLTLNEKFTALRSLVPSPTKSDRASVVGDAIEYIKELLRTVNELKLLVEKKRCGRERRKRPKTEEDGDPDQSYNGPLRSSWLQRKSKDTEVDVRIIDDEVTIKLVQRKINCLLFVSKVLEELQLDLHHVAGGHIGDYYSFLFNTKIYEGSSVYASAIANKLIEVVDRQYAAIPPSSSY
ncbi:HLH domain-containing protein [Cephalotus follicularis]|uniref:HLH domain-containing protein n=1 Tax=Cephalotus follicularis TaxID=3775 RepID=A0A1Q3BV42_CEPFO|nr:HLH domain-containing protein [Cephalotus follicularis]